MVGFVTDDHFRCHELARAVLKSLKNSKFIGNSGLIVTDSKMLVIDGRYGAVEHSWIVARMGQPAILGVYAVGSLPQVQLVDPFAPRGSLYRVGTGRTDIREGDLVRIVEMMSSAAANAAQ